MELQTLNSGPTVVPPPTAAFNRIKLRVGAPFGQVISLSQGLEIAAKCTNAQTIYELILCPGVHELNTQHTYHSVCAVEIISALSDEWDRRNTQVICTDDSQLCFASLRLKRLFFNKGVVVRNTPNVRIENCLFGTKLTLDNCEHLSLQKCQVSCLGIRTAADRDSDCRVDLTHCLCFGLTHIVSPRAYIRASTFQQFRSNAHYLTVAQCVFGITAAVAQLVDPDTDHVPEQVQPDNIAPHEPVVRVENCGSGKFSECIVDGGVTQSGLKIAGNMTVVLSVMINCKCAMELTPEYKGVVSFNRIERNRCGISLDTLAAATVEYNWISFNGLTPTQGFPQRVEEPLDPFMSFAQGCGILLHSFVGDSQPNTLPQSDTSSTRLAVIRGNKIFRNPCGIVTLSTRTAEVSALVCNPLFFHSPFRSHRIAALDRLDQTTTFATTVLVSSFNPSQ